LAQTKKEKGRFGVGAGLRGQIPDRPPILKGSVGPSKAPLAYRPTSSLPNPPGQVKRRKRVGSELGRSFEVRSSIGRRSAGDQSDRVKLRSLIVLRPPCPTPRARCLRSKSSSSKWASCGLRVSLRRRGCDRMRTQRRSPGTHTEVRPGVVVVVQRGVSSSSSSSSCRGALPRCLWRCHLRHCAAAVLVLMLVQLCWCRWCGHWC